jgi:hypothetical protein
MARYVEIVFRHWLRFLLLLVLMPGVLSGASILLLRTYQASAALWVTTPAYLGSAAEPADWNRYLTPAQNQQDSLGQMLETRSFGNALGQRLLDSGVLPNDAAVGQVLGSLSKNLTVQAAGSHLVSITYTCDRPPVCLGVIDGVVAVYHDRLTELQKLQSDLASSFLTSQLKEAQVALDTSETNLRTYLSAHPGTMLIQAPAIPELDLLVRRVDLDRSEVTHLTEQLGGVHYSSAAAARVVDSIANVIDPPKISRSGIIGGSGARRRAILVVLACWAAVTAYLLLLAWLDRTARDPQEIERRLPVPVLVTIPHFAGMGKF